MLDWRAEDEDDGGADKYLDPVARAWCSHQLSYCIETSIYIAWDVHILRKLNGLCYKEQLQCPTNSEVLYFHNTVVQCHNSKVKHIFL